MHLNPNLEGFLGVRFAVGGGGGAPVKVLPFV